MNTCPHGLVVAVSVPELLNHLSRGPTKSPQVRIIHDARDCPDCLWDRVNAADAVLTRVFINRLAVDAETYQLWLDYVARYNI